MNETAKQTIDLAKARGIFWIKEEMKKEIGESGKECNTLYAAVLMTALCELEPEQMKLPFR